MADERASFLFTDSSNVCEREDQNSSCLLDRDIAAGKYKGTHASHLQGDSLELPIANAFVSSKDNPAFLPRALKPDFVGSALGEMIGKSFDQRASVAQCCRHGIAVQRFVEKKPDSLRLP